MLRGWPAPLLPSGPLLVVFSGVGLVECWNC